MPRFDKDDAMDLRVAAARYKRDHSLNSSAALSLCAKLVDGRTSLPKFLAGDTDHFDGFDQLAAFLRQNGYYPPSSHDSTHFAYTSFSGFFQSHLLDSINKNLDLISGIYECYQWSSTSTGMVIISNIVIEHNSSSALATAVETQFHKKSETYNGCCFYSNGKMFLMMREIKDSRPKFCILDEFDSEKMSGLYLKSSTKKAMHVSGIYMRRVKSSVNPRIDFIDEIDKEAREHLKEPLTSFDLTRDPRRDHKIQKELRAVLDQFHVKKDDKDQV